MLSSDTTVKLFIRTTPEVFLSTVMSYMNFPEFIL